MSWILIILFLIAVYLLIAGYIKSNNLFEKYIMFYGPIMAIKTENVKFFDIFIPYSRFFRGYGTAGAIVVVIVSVIMSAMMILTFIRTLENPPMPTGIYEPQNILAIPGVNEFMPLTFAVIFGFIMTIVIHEGGHGILSRVEGMRVKSTGLLYFIIPIGAFVEPEEEDVKNAKRMARVRMYGAGITNNLVVSAVCMILLICLLSFAVPNGAPYVSAVYKDYPAYNAGLTPDSIITSIDGELVHSVEDVYYALDGRMPGDYVVVGTVSAYDASKLNEYNLTLSAWPENSGMTGGFMGVSYYNSINVKAVLDTFMVTPLAPLLLIYIPIDSVINSNSLGLAMLAFDTPQTLCWDTPIPYFWEIIHIFFWMFWLNFAVGTFNALPFVPLDGGLIMQEGITHLCEKRKLDKKVSDSIVAAVSWFMIMVVVMIILIPYLFHI